MTLSQEDSSFYGPNLFQYPLFFFPVKLCIYTFPGANRHSRKWTQTLLKGKIGFFFRLCSLPSGHP